VSGRWIFFCLTLTIRLFGKFLGVFSIEYALENAKIFNIQRYSVQDGPGIRTTIFLKAAR
jgi:hypothetical protein